MRKLWVGLMVAALGLAACSGDGGDGEDPTDGATTGGETTPADDCADLTGSPTFTITIQDNSFDPPCAIAERSQALTLENQGSRDHTFTIDDTQVDVPVGAGETANLEAINDALAAGTYTVYCRFHGSPDGGGMAMELTAQ